MFRTSEKVYGLGACHAHGRPYQISSITYSPHITPRRDLRSQDPPTRYGSDTPQKSLKNFFPGVCYPHYDFKPDRQSDPLLSKPLPVYRRKVSPPRNAFRVENYHLPTASSGDKFPSLLLFTDCLAGSISRVKGNVILFPSISQPTPQICRGTRKKAFFHSARRTNLSRLLARMGRVCLEKDCEVARGCPQWPPRRAGACF